MNAQALRSEVDSLPELVSVQQARPLAGNVATQTIFTLALRGELDVRQVAGRFVVTRASLLAFRARHKIA